MPSAPRGPRRRKSGYRDLVFRLARQLSSLRGLLPLNLVSSDAAAPASVPRPTRQEPRRAGTAPGLVLAPTSVPPLRPPGSGVGRATPRRQDAASASPADAVRGALTSLRRSTSPGGFTLAVRTLGPPSTSMSRGGMSRTETEAHSLGIPGVFDQASPRGIIIGPVTEVVYAYTTYIGWLALSK